MHTFCETEEYFGGPEKTNYEPQAAGVPRIVHLGSNGSLII
jgi:hypothetical protein